MADAARKGRNAMQKRTHCPRGHALAGGNLVVHLYRAKGRRNCLSCRREANRRYQRDRRSAAREARQASSKTNG